MTKNVLIKDISDSNKPRERLLYKGSNALSDSELIAIILGTGGKNSSALDSAGQLLKEHKTLKNLLGSSAKHLQRSKNIGPAKSASIKAAYEIAKRINSPEKSASVKIKTPEDVFKVAKKYFHNLKTEHLYLMSLDTRKKVISFDLISAGAINETIFPIREIIQKALENNAVYIIICHNHPSNDPTPSKEDIIVTKTLEEACHAIGLGLIDHLIVSENRFYSIKSINFNMKGGE